MSVFRAAIVFTFIIPDSAACKEETIVKLQGHYLTVFKFHYSSVLWRIVKSVKTPSYSQLQKLLFLECGGCRAQWCSRGRLSMPGALLNGAPHLQVPTPMPATPPTPKAPFHLTNFPPPHFVLSGLPLGVELLVGKRAHTLHWDPLCNCVCKKKVGLRV